MLNDVNLKKTVTMGVPQEITMGVLDRPAMKYLVNSLLLTALLASGIARAQNDPGAASYEITGNVRDPSGAAIVGAQVTLNRADGKQVGQTSSKDAGTFRFISVAPGAYQVDVQQEGFRETKVKVTVGLKARSSINVVMPLAVVSQEFTVTATGGSAPQVSTEISENQNANSIDRAALDRVPVFDHDYVTMLSRFLDDSALGTNGVTLVVNGVEANGPGMTPSAVQEVKINQDPYSALFSRPGRARLEIITKPGTPNFHGTVNLLFRDSLFDARNPFSVVKPSEHRQYYEGSLSGPLGHSKKTSFLLSLDRDVDDDQAVVVAQGPTGPITQNVPMPTHHFFGSGRVFHDFGSADQFWIGYSYEKQSERNQNVGGTVLPEAGTRQVFQEHEINVSYRHVFSPKMLNQLRFLVGHYDRPVISVTAAPAIVVAGAFTGGGAQADGRRTEYHFDGTDILTYVSGKHELKFGVDIPDISRRGEDNFTNFGGTYSFASLADYIARRPSFFVQQRGQGHLVFLEENFAGVIEDKVRLRPNLSLSVGMRYYWQNYFHNDPNNFAPRFGFAWAPTEKSKTVVRGGAGVFYDRSGPRPISDLLHFNGTSLLRFIVENPTFPVAPGSLAAEPTSVVVLDPRARIPYTLQYSVGVERQLTQKSSLSATYVGSRRMDAFRSRDINAPLPPNFTVLPNPQLGQVRQMESEGYQKGNSLEVTFRGKPSKFFAGQAQYTLSKTYNNTSGITYFPGNSYFPNADWARSDSDRRHKFDLMGSVEATKLVSLGVALSLYSGTPVNITTGADDNHDGIANDRPLGLPRNVMHGPGLVNLDLSLAHDFQISKKKEGPMATLSLQSFNVLNHENDDTYIGTLSSPFFGRAVAAHPGRRMQVNLEFKF